MKNLVTTLSCTGALLFCSSAFATLFTVPTAKTQTIQAAIDAANQNGDEIMVLPGVYFEQINYLGKSVRIYSQGGAIMTYIDGQSTSGPLVTFHTAEDENAILEGFTVRNAPNGAGISANGSSPTILSCKIVGNSGSNGGGFKCQDANILIDECEIKNNTSTNGAGMWMSGGSLTMSNTLLRGNQTTSSGDEGGGGIYATGTILGIAWCDFEDNVANDDQDSRGGAIAMYANASLSMANTNLVNNTSNMTRQSDDTEGYHYSRGGAIYATGCTATITSCDFLGNQAYMYLNDTHEGNNGDQGGVGIAQGGDLALYDFTNIQTHNCSHLDANAHAYGHGYDWSQYSDFVQPISMGGSVYMHGSAIFMTNALVSNCTVTHVAAGNNDGTPRGDGGALYSDSNGNPFLTNCQIIGCSASYNGWCNLYA